MGNQIVCPSGQNWFLSDFEKMGIVIDYSIYDGTLLLSFKASTTLPKRNLVVKAFKIPINTENDNKESNKAMQEYYYETMDVIKNSEEYFKKLNKANIVGIIANTPSITEEGAYLVRPYIHYNLQTRMNDFPELTAYEKDWISYQILRTIIELHKSGFYHGDIKPENILLTERLQVQIVDFAPFKPVFINKSQPNFFLHYFNYGGNTSFLAPERVSDGFDKPDSVISLLKSDLFSVGCLLAYLYLGGKYLFTFTTIQEYKNGGEVSKDIMKQLDGIQDQKKRDFIKMLLSLDPDDRNMTEDDLLCIYPTWFGKFYDFFYQKHLGTAYMEVTLKLHDEVMKMLPEDLGDGSLIYFNILSDVILSSGRVSTLNKLIDYYVDMTTKYFDAHMKLSRAIPTLFEIFERGVNAASIRAFDAITKIFDSIDKIPDEFSNYHTAFLLPRLSLVLKDGWATTFVCDLPKWATSMHRLWPTFYTDLRSDISICQYLFTVNSRIIASEEASISDIGFIRSYLKSCTVASKEASFELLSTLCFFLFPLLSTSLFLPDIVDMICAFYNNFNENQKTKFNETLEDPIFVAIFACEVPEDQKIPVLNAFKKLLSIKMKKRYLTNLAIKTIEIARNSTYGVISAAKDVIELLPKCYKKAFFASTAQITNEDSSAEEQQIVKEDLENTAVTSKEFIVKNEEQTDINLNYKFFCSNSVGDFINAVFWVGDDSIVILHDYNELTRYAIKIDEKPILRKEFVYKHQKKIFCIEQISKTKFCFSDNEEIYIFDLLNGILESIYTNRSAINIAFVTEDLIAVAYDQSNVVDFLSATNLDLKKREKYGENPISFIKNIEGMPLFCIGDNSGNIFVIDSRISLPIKNIHLEGAYDVIPIDNRSLTLAVVSNNAIEVLSFTDSVSTLTIEGENGSVNSVESVLYVSGVNGTFYVDTKNPENSFSLPEKGNKERLSINRDGSRCVIRLPSPKHRSLNYHVFDITCGCYNKGYFATGDSHGFINLWYSCCK